MTESPIENDFLSRLTAMIEKNISNEQFGVFELADLMNMSRSNLLRKVKKETGRSVNQLIRDMRLNRGMDLLLKSALNVSEVSHQVGFSSTSYFIKCFREYYGYPPGEVGKRNSEEIIPVPISRSNRNRSSFFIGSAGFVIAITIGLFVYFGATSSKQMALEKSIAVLPFKNESNDSTNIYLINGLMEATLTNLQRIEDLRVISRTSSEKYSSLHKSIPEMAKELSVNYFVEGSGQKIGNQILLNIQLIGGPIDKHLWAKQYKREVKDIFALQQEIAENIVEEIQAIITPEEKKRLKRIPTDDLVAYDYFLKGKEVLFRGNRQNLEDAITYFNKAIQQDHKFALAYAGAAIAFYYLDAFQTHPKYTDELGGYADKAWLYDPKSDECLVAKALFYMHKREYELAIPYLEKALEYNPNSSLAVLFISDLYNGFVPNTGKYLQYALVGARINVTADSAAESYTYMHLSNALIQTGFVDEAMKYINKSLSYNSENGFAAWIKIGILFVKNKDAGQTRKLLIKELNKDTVSRFYLLQEIGRSYYFQQDYKNAYRYYRRFIAARQAQQVDIYKNESLKIGIVLDKLGMKEDAKKYINIFKGYAFNDKSIYKSLNLAAYYAWLGDKLKSMEHLKLFSKEDDFQYWILFLASDPVFYRMRDLPEFKITMSTIEKNFWRNHEKLRTALEEKGLLEVTTRNRIM